jgi:hypothetical protein
MEKIEEIVNEMAVAKEISNAIYALDTCYIQIFKDGGEDYLSFGENVWGNVVLSEKDRAIYNAGVGADEIDIEKTIEYLEDEQKLLVVKKLFEGEDICFGANTPMGIIKEITNFNYDLKKADCVVEYDDGETKDVSIYIDDDFEEFDAIV